MKSFLASVFFILSPAILSSAEPAAVISERARRHWSFQPLHKPDVPSGHADNSKSPIDQFVQARLKAAGLGLSLATDKRTFIRRVTYDLTGLPPSVAEIDAFLKDDSPTAYEKLIDRLLASPQYGEQWGRHWLDIARYADTKGYVFFQDSGFPWAWTYRDYVIEALNADLPYNQFLTQQLAADLLPLGDDKRPLRALGFLTLGSRFMNNQHDILDDRIDVVTRGLLGLTVTCARCHDHKFDPVPTTDYYSLYSVFASCEEPEVPPLYAPPPKTAEYEKFAKELASREGKLHAFLERKRNDLIKGAKERAGEYLFAAYNLRDKPRTDEFMLLTDANELNPKMIVRWQMYLERTRKNRNRVWTFWHAFADVPPNEFPSLAKKVVAQVVAADGCNPIIADAFLLQPPSSMADVARRYGDVLSVVERMKPTPGNEDCARSMNELRQVAHGPDAPANVKPVDFSELELLPDRPAQAELQKLRKEVEQWRASGTGAPPRAMVLNDLPKPTTQRVFLRGNPFSLGPKVERRFLSLLSGKNQTTFSQGSGRLELARAIASSSNPLTARVIANRVWLHYFGKGLVATPSDFGLRSDPPTHPELLDYLASTLIEDGWSLKKLHKQIVLSATYRQSSSDRADGVKADPENTLLWKMPRKRLNFEELRDSLLAVSGKLDRKVGGPSVQGFLEPVANRRTLYAHLDRLNVPGIYRTFDFPSPDACSPKRDLTTVPPQALFMMNHKFVQECAKNLLLRPEITAEKNTDKRIERIYEVVYGRAAFDKEKEAARDFVSKGGDVLWHRFAHALLQTNEFVFVD